MQKRVVLSNLIHLKLSIESLLNVATYRKNNGLCYEIIEEVKNIEASRPNLIPSNFLSKYEKIVNRLTDCLNFNFQRIANMIQKLTFQIDNTIKILY